MTSHETTPPQRIQRPNREALRGQGGGQSPEGPEVPGSSTEDPLSRPRIQRPSSETLRGQGGPQGPLAPGEAVPFGVEPPDIARNPTAPDAVPEAGVGGIQRRGFSRRFFLLGSLVVGVAAIGGIAYVSKKEQVPSMPTSSLAATSTTEPVRPAVSPAASPEASATPTSTSTSTPEATRTPTSSPTSTSTPTRVPTNSPTPSPSPTEGPRPGRKIAAVFSDLGGSDLDANIIAISYVTRLFTDPSLNRVDLVNLAFANLDVPLNSDTVNKLNQARWISNETFLKVGG